MSSFYGVALKDRLLSDVKLLKVGLNVHNLCIKVLNGRVVQFTSLCVELFWGYWSIVIVVSQSDLVLELRSLFHLIVYAFSWALELDVGVRVCSH